MFGFGIAEILILALVGGLLVVPVVIVVAVLAMNKGSKNEDR